MSSGSGSGTALVGLMLLASTAVGLGAMALGAYGLWASANRFPEASTALLVAQGFACLVVVGLLGSFCYAQYTVLRPLVVKTPGSADKLNGLMVVMAPAATGLLLTVYIGVAIVVLRLAHWIVAD